MGALLSSPDSPQRIELISKSGITEDDIPHAQTSLDAKSIIRQVRPKQWVKNLLVFMPIVASHSTDPAAWFKAVLAFVVFSALASTIYVLNDLLDLEADRAHPTKHARPIASGDLSIHNAVFLMVVLFVISSFGSIALGPSFLLVAAIYFLLTTAYSFRLKALKGIDIITLAALFSIRVIAGAAATEVQASLWFLGFVAPVFLSLATVKRLTEVTRRQSKTPVLGRAYGFDDRAWLLLLAGLSALVAVCVFLAYSYTQNAMALYDRPGLFRCSALPLAIWLFRMIQTSWTGQQGYDPISHALRDYIGLSLVLAAAILVALAI